MGIVRSADGTPIGFKRMGSGPPLVLVHEMAGSYARWEQECGLVDVISVEYDRAAPDLVAERDAKRAR